MATIDVQTVSNGLPLFRLSDPGTRAVTALIAFNAGARTEKTEENGMAHFLEHLVFKGGQKYDSYRKINDAAEGIGAVLNAFTSHDLVAFHITCRSEVLDQALDLLTDFVGRPIIGQDELDRERGVVIQEIARAHDQPSVLAGNLIDKASFGDHPLGHTILGPEENIRTFSRDAIMTFRKRQWAGFRGGAFLAGNLSYLPNDGSVNELFERLPNIQENGDFQAAPPLSPQILVEQRDSKQSHLRISYRPSIDVMSLRERVALNIYSTILGGSMGSRLFDEIRDQRSLAYSVFSTYHIFSDVPVLQLGAGLQSDKCIEAFTRMREIVDELRTDGPTQAEFERARQLSAGRRVIAFENTNVLAIHAAKQTVSFEQDVNPDVAIQAIDNAKFEDVRKVAAEISLEHAIACVGPHTVDEFSI